MKPLRYHESRQRGSTDFPLEYCYLDQRQPRYQMPCHWHEEYEILHVLQGEFDLTLDGEAMTLHPGETAFIAPERLHGGAARNCVYACVVFDIRLLLQCNDLCKQQILELHRHAARLRAVYPAQDPAARHAIPAMFRALHDQSPGYELIALGCLYQFLGEMYQRGAFPPEEPEQSGEKRVTQLKQVFELIETAYASPLTLSDMAAAAHMSPKYFCRFFKAVTRRTPVDYLNDYRIEEACGEIAATEKPLMEIALDTGFSNLNYFIRQFKKYKGITPGRYMNQVRAM